MRQVIAYAPVGASDGKLTSDSCKGDRLHQYRVYRTREAAVRNKVYESDKIVKVVIVVPE